MEFSLFIKVAKSLASGSAMDAVTVRDSKQSTPRRACQPRCYVKNIT